MEASETRPFLDTIGQSHQFDNRARNRFITNAGDYANFHENESQGSSVDKDHGTKYLGNTAGIINKITQAVKSFVFLFCSSVTVLDKFYVGDKELYLDKFNDQSWKCSYGTKEEDGIWMNKDDPPGTILSMTVGLLIAYSSLTVILLAETDHLPPLLAMMYITLSIMSLACHVKTTYTDPGSIPESAIPIESNDNDKISHNMCSQCHTFKPPFSHHCRICNRCISRMDHHCPWMNNCIGIGNLKHFILFLVYTWSSSALALLIFGWNYFLCDEKDCEFNAVLVELVRVMTIICICTLLFTSSMIMNVVYGVMSGIGTIDRLKKKTNNTMSTSDEEPIPLKHIFGVAGYYTWPFPIDPVYDDFDCVMGYCTPQRLLREQLKENKKFSGQVS